jgi:hypothetical protein
MTRRFTVMGFTEAELGFVLAGVFAALSLSGLSAQQSTASAAARSDTLARRYDSLSAAFAAYRGGEKKRSNKTPRCSEKGESPNAVAELRVLGRDLYELDGESLTYRQVEVRLQPQIARSEQLGCRYLVRTIATPGVDGPDHSAAVSRLWAHFDVNERQP